jgi:hypothetical protein
MSVPDFIKRIDFTTLRNQKATLLLVIGNMVCDNSNPETNKIIASERDDLDGILTLIDALQAYAVDANIVDGIHVYDFELEEKRDNEKPEEKFARENASIIFQMHIEGTGLYENEDLPEEFIKTIIDDNMHASLIKNLIRRDILNDFRINPDNFETDPDGNLTYDASMYDYGFAIEEYCREKYYEGKKQSLWLCPNCGSDNVEVKNWVNANTGKKGTDCEDKNGYCVDCGRHGEVILSEVKYKAKVIGFQIRGTGHDVDGELHSGIQDESCVHSLSQVREIMKGYHGWKIVAIWTGDIRKPIMMFKGDPRD